MIKKLKRRFITITMLLISTVLIVTFSIQVYSSYSKMRTDSIKNLDHDLEKVIQGPTFDEIKFPDRSPFDSVSPFNSFYVEVDSSGEIVQIHSFNRNLNTDIVDEAVLEVLENDDELGTLGSLNLRYKVYDNVIGFVDISYEQAFIRQQILNYSLIGFLSLLAFLLISVLLSQLAVAPIDKAWKKQQRFVADASHELKTPITVLLANTSIIKSNQNLPREELDKWVSNIEHETKHMKKLVEDLLFLARIDDKSQKDAMYDVDLSDLVFETTLPFEALMFESNLTFESNIDPDIKVKGNQERLKQLILILLDNARKYAFENTLVKVNLVKENNKVMLSVSNKGEVIDEEHIPFLFDRFYKVDKARTRNEDSFGLGLSIAKEIVDLHDAKISVTSVDEATTFTITF